MGRSHNCVRPSNVAANASVFPSGDNARASTSRVGGDVTSKRTSASESDGVRLAHTMPAPAATASSTSAAAQTSRSGRRARPASRVSTGASPGASSRSRRASWMSASRRLGSFCRQRRKSRRTPSGLARTRSQSGSALSTSLSVSVTEAPSNAARPASISYSTQPNAHTSLRLSAGASPRLLGAHVRSRAQDRRRRCVIAGRRDRRRAATIVGTRGRASERLGQAEVQHLDRAVRRAP